MTEGPAAAPPIAIYGERNASAPAELNAFAFLISKWEGAGRTKLPDGKVAEFAGVSWIGRYILDGMAIADEFHASTPDGNPYLGISFRQYDPQKKAWIVEYVNVSNSRLRRQVNATSGSVMVDGQSVVVVSQGADAWSRETYRVDSSNDFMYIIDISNDGGRNWVLGQIEIGFVRKE